MLHFSEQQKELLEDNSRLRKLLRQNQLLLEKRDQKIAELLKATVLLDEEDNLYLVSLLLQVLKTNREFNNNTFIYKLLQQQLRCLLPSKHNTQKEGREFRWDPAIIHWAITIQYHGGKGLIDILRGQAFQHQESYGKLTVDPKLWGLFLPANSTLRKYLPPVFPYEGNTI
jgi:hypothetical protein